MVEGHYVTAQKMKAVACQSFHLNVKRKAVHTLVKVKGSTVEISESMPCAAADG